MEIPPELCLELLEAADYLDGKARLAQRLDKLLMCLIQLDDTMILFWATNFKWETAYEQTYGAKVRIILD